MVDKQPVLFEDLEYAWDGWEELTFSRDWSHDGGPTSIKHTEIVAWLDLNQVEDNERFNLYRTIKHIDLMWLNVRRKFLKKKRGNTTSSDRSAKHKRRGSVRSRR